MIMRRVDMVEAAGTEEEEATSTMLAVVTAVAITEAADMEMRRYTTGMMPSIGDICSINNQSLGDIFIDTVE